MNPEACKSETFYTGKQRKKIIFPVIREESILPE
jgi:hypothetical protein